MLFGKQFFANAGMRKPTQEEFDEAVRIFEQKYPGEKWQWSRNLDDWYITVYGELYFSHGLEGNMRDEIANKGYSDSWLISHPLKWLKGAVFSSPILVIAIVAVVLTLLGIDVFALLGLN